MTRTQLLLAFAATAALAGCNKDNSHTIGGPEEQGPSVNVANVELPPSISSSKSYRCKDNSIVYLDWLSDKKSANLRTKRNGEPIHLEAAQPGQPLTGSGYTVGGGFAGPSIALTKPGGSEQSCEA